MKPMTITATMHPLNDVEIVGRELHARLVAEAREALAAAIESGDFAGWMLDAVS